MYDTLFEKTTCILTLETTLTCILIQKKLLNELYLHMPNLLYKYFNNYIDTFVLQILRWSFFFGYHCFRQYQFSPDHICCLDCIVFQDISLKNLGFVVFFS